MGTRSYHWWLLARYGLVVLVSAETRTLFNQMRHFCRHLPPYFQQPLPDAMTQLTPQLADQRIGANEERRIRHLSDLAGVLERSSPLGICMRRSLTRYHFLRERGVPVTVVFGAKFKPALRQAQDTATSDQPSAVSPKSITGHAWLTLDDEVYFESAENYQDFTPMFRWPQP